MSNNKIIIEKYINDELNNEERAAFLKDIKNNEALRNEYNEYLDALSIIKAAGREDIRSRLKNVGFNIDKKRKVNRIVALCIVSVILIGSIFVIRHLQNRDNPNFPIKNHVTDSISDIAPIIQIKDTFGGNKSEEKKSPENIKHERASNDRRINNDELFAMNYEPFRDPSIEPSFRGQEEPGEKSFEQLYWEKDYLGATVAFDKLPGTSKQNDNLRFLYAIAQIEINNYSLAENILSKIVEDKQTRFEEAAEFYLVLLSLKTNKVERGKALARTISNDKTHRYNVEVSKLLIKIK